MPVSITPVALAAFFAQRAVSVAVPPSGNPKTEDSRHAHRILGTAVGLRVRVRVRAYVGDTDGVEQERT